MNTQNFHSSTHRRRPRRRLDHHIHFLDIITRNSKATPSTWNCPSSTGSNHHEYSDSIGVEWPKDNDELDTVISSEFNPTIDPASREIPITLCYSPNTHDGITLHVPFQAANVGQEGQGNPYDMAGHVLHIDVSSGTGDTDLNMKLTLEAHQ